MMNIKSVDYIVTAKHYGNGSARGYIRKMQRGFQQRGIPVTIKDIEKEPTGVPVYARIWQGQWIADCECNSASFVDPDEPVFFCFGCGNRSNGRKPRPVRFPAEWKEIEQILLERPVDDLAGLTDLERAGMAKAVLVVEIEEEVLEPLDMQTIMEAARSGVLPPSRKMVKTLPLTRSWEPGETVEDLHRQQEEPIRKWKKELKEGKAPHGIQ
jgi:hypothetical protein